MSIGKKIIGSVVVATSLWAGMTAYISSNTETYLKNYVQKTNRLYSNNGMSSSLLSFEKGFLNSKAKISIDFTDPNMRKELQNVIKLPIVMSYNIGNGPLFFKNGFNIGASKVNSTVNINDLLVNKQDIKAFIKDDIIINTNMLIGFNNQATYTGESNTIVANIDEDIFTISPLKLSGEMNMKTFVGNFKLFINNLSGKLENKGDVKLQEIALNTNITKFFDNGFYLGDIDFNINKVNIKNPNFPQEIKDAKMNIQMNIDQNSSNLVNMNFGMNLKLGETELPKEYNFLKEFTLNYGINGAKLKGLLAFQDVIKDIQTEQQTIMKKLSQAKTEDEQMVIFNEMQKSQEALEDKLVLLISDFLVKEQTTLNVETIITDKSDIDSNAKFNITYIGDEALPKTAKELSKKFKQELLNWVKLNINVEVQKSLVDKLPKELQQQLAMAMMTGMLKDNNSSYSFDANYMPKKLTVNGEDKSDMLMLVEMGLKGSI